MTNILKAPSRSHAVLSMVGNTPLIPLHFAPEGLSILVKCEFVNPSGSIKDRFAKGFVADAIEKQVLGPESIILECSSGNTGIAFAMIGAAIGCRVKVLMSDGASDLAPFNKSGLNHRDSSTDAITEGQGHGQAEEAHD